MSETLTNTPLVSVVVITYNSSRYVLETLESIKSQTYKNIELVISDDCSTDETVAICQKWIGINQERFVRTEIVLVDKNTGVAPNCNRGLKAAQGEWIKLIAGDDLLYGDAIDAYVGFAKENPKAEVIVSDMECFGEKNHRVSVNKSINDKSADWQLKKFLLLAKDGVPHTGPPWFHKRKVLEAIGGYDLSYPMIEDFPTVLRLLDNGVKVYALNHVCVGYRVVAGSLSTEKGFMEKFLNMYLASAFPVIKKRKLFLILYEFYVFRAITLKKNKIMNIKIFRYALRMTSPYSWVEYVRKRVT
ncbi:glycosyltransferase [Alcanivorax sp. 521-1]|uniref:Glycosyltransferase n=1 Tax=Alloalcanivorax profundimaris TaxID=2735259 RepID=A0ABS0APL2_9GAMM|nr:glycosyltransferase [Alloalcanivorax profundimaris]MBF5056075.1 glycosyltransferase [Alloalcanivorax profundimaris]